MKKTERGNGFLRSVFDVSIADVRGMVLRFACPKRCIPFGGRNNFDDALSRGIMPQLGLLSCAASRFMTRIALLTVAFSLGKKRLSTANRREDRSLRFCPYFG